VITLKIERLVLQEKALLA